LSREDAGSDTPLTAGLLRLQRRLSAATPALSIGPRDLYKDVYALLLRAIRDQVLRNGMYTVKKLLRLTPDPEGRPSCWVLTGGPIDFGRTAEPDPDTRFVRTDGGIVHFQMTLLERDARSVEVLAYSFEVYFPSRDPIAFVRFDLNFRGHSNDEAGLRSHLHPGNDDLQLPSPVLEPLEALLVVLYGCRPQREVARS
jgi:hypothetical protein